MTDLRHEQHLCEKCRCRGTLTHNTDEDEYWCESCWDNAAEAAYDRWQERLMEGDGPPSLAEQAAAARKLK